MTTEQIRKQTKTFRVDDWFHKYIMIKKHEEGSISVQHYLMQQMGLTEAEIKKRLSKKHIMMD